MHRMLKNGWRQALQLRPKVTIVLSNPKGKVVVTQRKRIIVGLCCRSVDLVAVTYACYFNVFSCLMNRQQWILREKLDGRKLWIPAWKGNLMCKNSTKWQILHTNASTEPQENDLPWGMLCKCCRGSLSWDTIGNITKIPYLPQQMKSPLMLTN